jgi:hypothetical protein
MILINELKGHFSSIFQERVIPQRMAQNLDVTEHITNGAKFSAAAANGISFNRRYTEPYHK